MMVERHDCSLALIRSEFFCNSRHETIVAAFNALQLNHDRHAASNQIKHLFKRWRAISGTANMKLSSLCERQIANTAFASGKALEVIIMKHDDAAVFGQMHVAFNCKASFRCCIKGCERVFPAIFIEIVEATMRNWLFLEPFRR